MLLDILEHLKRPERLLGQCHEVLNFNGALVVSLPNVADITVRLTLLFDRFNYSERGILDKTHAASLRAKRRSGFWKRTATVCWKKGSR